ncbi:hypothetical protein JQS43_23270 [Natronosporangium hydrolyticum]|uniref:Uncharacterized protein n=1 Tax=Natronosporangium hydrolyticum TaxID=2811111 RepID=A0A895YFX8_9ACTN|nr:hypothetical protein [Natronosporangium hydrolyticum]QSB14379.1 hypothetical protein JQS43_23270 [Natronosporangium hydrolyticum]
MTTYYFVMDLEFATDGPDSPDDFDAFADRVLDALGELEEADSGIVDPDVTASLTKRTLSVLMGVVADSRDDARRLFAANVRTALHVAGCGTPGWPNVPGQLPAPYEPDYAPAS